MKLEDSGLRKQPFRPHGKPLELIPYASQQAAVRFLDRTRSDVRGMGLFHGPPLSGKTSIIRQYKASLPDDYGIAVVDAAATDTEGMLHDIVSQFGYDLDLDSDETFRMIRVFVMQQAAHDEAPLLVIENAHSLSPVAMETLCELADLNVKGSSAVRMVLASDRPMLPIVRAPAMESIFSRITGQFLLRPLTREETTCYLHRKLISGGCRKPQRVLPSAVCHRLYSASGGWPGMIDRLAMLAMAKAERCPVRPEHVPQLKQPAKLPKGVISLARPASKLRPAGGARPAPHLILTCRGKMLQRVAMDTPRLLIGRNELNDLCINSDMISRQHVILFRNDRATIVVDMKSKNGTYVNGKRVSSQVLINNDVISIGHHRIKFIDPAARRRTSLRGAGWDESTISESIKDLRRVIGR